MDASNTVSSLSSKRVMVRFAFLAQGKSPQIKEHPKQKGGIEVLGALRTLRVQTNRGTNGACTDGHF